MTKEIWCCCEFTVVGEMQSSHLSTLTALTKFDLSCAGVFVCVDVSLYIPRHGDSNRVRE